MHPSIVDLGGGHLRVFFRDRRAGHVYVADSLDDGASWSRPTRTQLPNNNASIQANKLRGQGDRSTLVMVFDNCNASVPGCESPQSSPNYRSPLSIALSDDGGATWPWVRDLETTNRYPESRGDPDPHRDGWQYPSVVQSTVDGKLYVSFSYARDTIKVAVVDEGWVRQGVGGNGTVGIFKGDPPPPS